MPNSIGPDGLTVATQSELVVAYTAAMEAIFGVDINLDPDSPDGQQMMIFLQSVLDLEDLLVAIYNSFDPDNATGNVLDQRVAINGIQRQAGTFSRTNITIITSQSLNLFGLDQSVQPIYTVADNAGNQWQLVTSISIPGPNTYVLLFQSAVPGAILTIPNTITVPVTIVLGVTSINNPTTFTILGVNEESDAALKIRRQKSTAIGSQGYLAALTAALLNISGVTYANVYENDSDITDGQGVPSHSIWVVVAGTGAAADIANAIYIKRNAGCGMFGMQSLTITQVNGLPFTLFWDDVSPETLFIKFTATSIDGINPPNIAAIVAQLPSLFIPGVNQTVNVNSLSTAVQEIDPNTLVTNAGFSASSGGSYTPTLAPSSRDKQFIVSTPDVIVIPMILSPMSVTVPVLGTQQFTPLGGFGTMTFSMLSNPSGGSINSSSGLYTAGATPATDVAKVIDSLGNIATAIITVV